MSELLVRASDVSGLPVVAIDSGEDVAEVKDVVYDGTHHELVGFTLNKRGWFRGRLRDELPVSVIVAIGPDAVMIEHDSDVGAIDAEGSSVAGAPTHNVMGNQVLGADGVALGNVSGVVLSTGRVPKAVGYEVTNDSGSVFVPISAQLALSDDNMILPVEATDFIRDDLAGFGAAVTNYRSALDGATTTTDSTQGAVT